MTAMIYCNGRQIISAPVTAYPPPYTGWFYSENLSWELLYADSLYYIGVEMNFPPGKPFLIGSDTAVHHNFQAETIAKLDGNWVTLNFVPVIQIICDPEGVSEQDSPWAARVFPNPACQTLFVENVQNASLNLYDLTGKLQRTDNGNSAGRHMDVSGLPSGIYMLSITGDHRSEHRKVVVQ